jgi:DNA-binding NarL/FixJ family response regulator
VIRVVLVDDHPVFREGLRFTLEQADGIQVVAEASDGQEGISIAEEHRPDVVVMDLAMPRLDGLASTAHLAASGLHVLVLTFSEEDASVLAAMRAGALGYLRKGADPDQVVSAVRATAAGHAVFGPGPPARTRSFATWPKVRRTRRSPPHSSSRRSPCATTSATSSRSCTSPTGVR